MSTLLTIARRNARRLRRVSRASAAGALLAAATLAGCRSDATAPASGPARIRYVNSVFQFTDAANTPASAVGRSLDVLLDSSNAPPSASSLAPASVSTSTGNAAGYVDVAPGVHSFVARIAGGDPPAKSLFTSTPVREYLPKQYLTPSTRYTFVVAGLAPAAGIAPPTAFPFTMLVDDPFPPPRGPDGRYQARFRVVNAAPFASAAGTGAPISVILTPGDTPPTPAEALSLAPIVPDAFYRASSLYANVTAGPYVLTIRSGSNVLAQQGLTLSAGEVRSFILQSTGPAATPGVANHALTVLLDATF